MRRQFLEMPKYGRQVKSMEAMGGKRNSALRFSIGFKIVPGVLSMEIIELIIQASCNRSIAVYLDA
jgi:hypothetical protein